MIRTTTIMQSNKSHISIIPKPIMELMEFEKGDKLLWEFETKDDGTKSLCVKAVD